MNESKNFSSSLNFSIRLLSSICFVLLFNLFLFNIKGGVALFFILELLFFYFLATFSTSRVLKNIDWVIINFIFISSVSISLIFRTNFLSYRIAILTAFFVLVNWSYLLLYEIPFFRSLTELIFAPWGMFLNYLKGVFRWFKILFDGKYSLFFESNSTNNNKNNNKLHKAVITGLIISLPIVIVLASLFSSDPIFHNFVKPLFSDEFLRRLFYRVAISLFLFLLLSPFLIMVKDKLHILSLRFLTFRSFVTEMSIVSTVIFLRC